MTLTALRASLLLWKQRLRYRKLRHAFYHDKSKRREGERTRLAAKWHKRVAQAQAMVTRRNRQIVSRVRANRKAAEKATGVTRYDGVPVAAVAVPYLQWAREHGWKGRLVSGWRDPEYSRSLCRRMCGADSCPGRCAGLSSNHVGSTVARFAIDVSDYQAFGRLMAKCPHSPRIWNGLGSIDPVHFSPNGQ